jgi:hypothetical protein
VRRRVINGENERLRERGNCERAIGRERESKSESQSEREAEC